MNVTREEIEHVLADSGYSAGARRNWLKTLLTDISRDESATPPDKKAELLALVGDFLNRNDPTSDDVPG